jgi:hypothetical protein
MNPLECLFKPVSWEMAASFATDPDIMSDFLFCRLAQIEIDTRIFSSCLYGDGGCHAL